MFVLTLVKLFTRQKASRAKKLLEKRAASNEDTIKDDLVSVSFYAGVSTWKYFFPKLNYSCLPCLIFLAKVEANTSDIWSTYECREPSTCVTCPYLADAFPYPFLLMFYFAIDTSLYS